MLTLVTGGSGSGKSAFAEDRVLSFGKGKSCDHSGIFDSLRFWLKYQQIKEQWQKFHHFLHHRGDLCGSCKGVRSVKYSKKGVDVCGKQTCTHPGKAEQKEFSLPLSHTQRGNQQGRSHAKKYIFNICHPAPPFLWLAAAQTGFL